MKVGIPRSLMFHKLGYLWTKFFENLNIDYINELSLYIKRYKNIEPWCIGICCDSKKGEAHKKNWIKLIAKIKSTLEINDYILDKYFGKKLTCNVNDLIEYKSYLYQYKLNFLNLVILLLNQYDYTDLNYNHDYHISNTFGSYCFFQKYF